MLPVSLLLVASLGVGDAIPVASVPVDRDARLVRDASRWLRAATAGEPDVTRVQQAAADRAAPTRDEAEGWRRRARLAGLLPRLVAEYRHDERSQTASGLSSGGEVDYVRLMPGDTAIVRLAWDLDTLVLGRSELAAVAAGEQAETRRREAAERATRLYFERMRLRLRIAADPPDSARARADAEVELAAVTAQLHALTGLYGEELR